MRIGVTGLRGIPGVMGGIESHCEELYPRLKQLRPNAEFFVIGRRPYISRQIQFKSLTVIPLGAILNKYIESISNTLLALFYLRFWLRCRLVHIHGIGPALASPIASLLGMKLIVTHHGEDFNRAKWNTVAKTALRLGENLAIRRAHAIIVVSQGLAINLRQRHPAQAQRIFHIPNGATQMDVGDKPPGWIEATLADLGLTRDGYILTVGRLVPEKGFDDLITAFVASGRTGKLVIAGKADHNDSFARGLLSRASPNVVFAGFLPHDKLSALYRGAALFVLPSYHEGLPIAALEAAAVGCPMLLSGIEPNLEIGLDRRNYFPVGDKAALAECLAQNSTSFEIDSAAIIRRYQWSEIAEATAQVYDKVMGKSVAPAGEPIIQ